MKGKRRWLGQRVWVADETDGKKRNGTLWWTEHQKPHHAVLPKGAEGVRWGFGDGYNAR